jgi:hypothetical protein
MVEALFRLSAVEDLLPEPVQPIRENITMQKKKNFFIGFFLELCKSQTQLNLGCRLADAEM